MTHIGKEGDTYGGGNLLRLERLVIIGRFDKGLWFHWLLCGVRGVKAY